MSIASEIQRVQGAIADAYDACEAKGATMPTAENIAALAGCIESIPSGGGADLSGYTYPNGTHPQTAIEVAVNLPAFESIVDEGDASWKGGNYGQSFLSFGSSTTTKNTTLKTLTIKSQIVSCCSYGKFVAYCYALASLNLPTCEVIGFGASASLFENCNALQSVTFPMLNRWSAGGSANIFNGCTALQSVSMPNFTQFNNSLKDRPMLFNGCTNLIDVTLGACTTNIWLHYWRPTAVWADATKTAQMNANIRDHIAANLPTIAAGSHSVGFYSGMIPYLEEATVAAFTSKGWTIQSV